MESIKIPSPSAILDVPSSSPPASNDAAASSSSRSAASSAPARSSLASTAKPNMAAGQTPQKPKQSKSRNGCITCKTKRLKCDESKPTCLQCERRKVQCGGYKRDFKWRPFEETNAVNKTSAKAKHGVVSSSVSNRKPKTNVPSRVTEHSFSPPKTQVAALGQGPSSKTKDASSEVHQPQKVPINAEEQVGQSNVEGLNEQTPESSLGELELPGPSPWLSDLFPSPAELETNPLGISWGPSPSKSDNFSFSALLAGEDDIEDIVRQSDTGAEPWFLLPEIGIPSPADDSSVTGSIPREPDLGIASPETLVLRYDKVTCGILSVKDGMFENPWRTLVWPMAKETPALYHAIFALAAFHACKENPAFRVHGVDNMRRSITYMVQDIQNMRTDAALATSLALAFADTWDQHTRSCIQHLRGAKALVKQVLDLAVQGNMHGTDLERVRFLHNTWLYMDVIARLTSRDGCESPEIDLTIFHLPGDVVHEIDPLMGCAVTLFPIINRVAGLIQRVRKSQSNSISMVSQAIELKRLLEQWEPPRWFEPPEDPTSEVQHSIQTAHAYCWATLLYLHQAVPEMPSEPTSQLAKRVLILLATVPPSSRTTIIQMFPLLVAGCEAEQEEDREWVMSRWISIQTRLMLGGIDRCIEVVQEVWTRRDAFQAEQERRHKWSRSGGTLSYDPPEPWRKRWAGEERAVSAVASHQTPRRSSTVTGLENIEHERTVRGRLHWVNVMEKWGWEVFLG